MPERLDEEQLARFVGGDCDEAETAHIEAILARSPEARAQVEHAQEDNQWWRAARPDQPHPRNISDTGSDTPATQHIDASPTAKTTPVASKSEELLGPTPAIDGYRIVREIHRGGQGVVYEAVQSLTRQRVAIKVLLHGTSASRAARRRFEREIELAAALKHANVVSILHSGLTTDGQQYYVMDFIRGSQIHHYVRAHRLSLEDTLRLFAQVCDAVQYAHHRGIIHRDLKPSNILIDANGVPHILDFGLAKWLAAPVDSVISLTEHVVGTLPYMSPEQARSNGAEIDARTDVYALGVLLYELLTGHFPYPVAGHMAEVLEHIRETPPTQPTRRWDSHTGITTSSARRVRAGQCPINDEVQTIVLRALAKEPERRYQSCGELARDIRHYLAGEPIEAKRDSRWYVLRKSLRRYRDAVAFGVLLFVVVAVSAVLLGVLWRKAEVEAEHAMHARAEAATAQQLAEQRSLEARAALDCYEQEALPRRQEYDYAFAQVMSAFAAHDMARLRDWLDACPQDLRGWEWRWINQQSDESGRTVRGHLAAVTHLHFLPDGQSVVSASEDGMVSVWGADWRERHMFGHPGRPPRAAGIRAHGNHLVTARDVVVLWDLTTGTALIERAIDGEPVTSVAWAPDGRALFTGSVDGQIARRDAHSMAVSQRARLVGGHPVYMAANPAGDVLAIADETGRIVVLNGETLAQSRAWQADPVRVESFAFSPDGTKIASQGSAAVVRVWDAGTGEPMLTLPGHEGPTSSVAFLGDGSIISGGRTLKIWDGRTGELRRALLGHMSPATAITASPDGSTLVSGSTAGTLKIWQRTPTQESSPLHPLTTALTAVALSAEDNTAVVLDAEGRPYALTLPDGQDVRPLPGNVSLAAIAASPRGRTLAGLSESGQLCVWADSWEAPPQRVSLGLTAPGKIAFGSSGDKIALGDASGTVLLLEWPSQHEHFRVETNAASVTDIEVSPDGTGVFVGRVDGVVELLSAADGGVLQRLTAGGAMPTALAVRPDGQRLVVARDDGGLAMWAPDAEIEGTWVHEVETDLSAPVTALVFTPDWKRLVAGGLRGTLEVRDAFTLTSLLELLPAGGPRVVDVAVETGGRRIVAAAGETLHVLSAPHAPGSPELRILEAQQLALPPGRAPAYYLRALTLARDAVRLQPDVPHYLNVLGAAQYRNGMHEVALETLREAAALRPVDDPRLDPMNLAFRVLAWSASGDEDAARKALELMYIYQKLQARATVKRRDEPYIQEAGRVLVGPGADLALRNRVGQVFAYVQHQFGRLGTRPEVLLAIENDAGLSEANRELARRIAKRSTPHITTLHVDVGGASKGGGQAGSKKR